jgi:hypothetical protein
VRLRIMNLPEDFSTISYLEKPRVTVRRKTRRALAIMGPLGRRHSMLRVTER